MSANHWITVASADHLARGRAGGFIQAGHGKQSAVRRMKPGDGIVCYAPRDRFEDGAPLQRFEIIGRIRAGDPYQGEMGNGFVPWRRDVDWAEARPAPIRPLLDALALTRGKAHWGAAFRYGVIGIDREDFLRIAFAMKADLSAAI